MTPWDALVSSVHSGGQDVRNPNSPDAASVLGTPAPLTVCLIHTRAARHCGLQQPEKQPFVRRLPRVDILPPDEHVCGHCRRPIVPVS